MAKPETLKIIAEAERRMRGNQAEAPRGGIKAHRDDGDDLSDFVDDGEDRETNARRPQTFDEIDTKKIYDKFNGRRTG